MNRPTSIAKIWNELRPNGYSPELWHLFHIYVHTNSVRFQDLCGRFEEPNAKRAWEKPLFVIGSESSISYEINDNVGELTVPNSDTIDIEQKNTGSLIWFLNGWKSNWCLEIPCEPPAHVSSIPVEEIFNAVEHGIAPRPNLATKQVPIHLHFMRM